MDAIERSVTNYGGLQAANLEKGWPVTLLGKWLPSVNASSKKTIAQGKKMARALGMSEADYRKALVRLRAAIRILENNMREKDYTFDYETQPSRALFKYRKAFARNDADRYNAFLSDVSKGKAFLNATNVSPYELVLPYLKWNGMARNDTAPTSVNRSINEYMTAVMKSPPNMAPALQRTSCAAASSSFFWGWA